MKYVKFYLSLISIDCVFNVVKDTIPSPVPGKTRFTLTITYTDGRRMGLDFDTMKEVDEAFDKICSELGAE